MQCYKMVVRAITNRFRTILGKIIDPDQSAFILGHLITDNILLGYECMHWICHTKNKQGYVSLKLDMSKTYDHVEWNYLRALMIKMGFDLRWFKLILKT